MRKKCLYLVDATAFCYRAFYALANLSTSFGQPTNAVYGFVNILNKLLKEEKPAYLAVCFDVSRDTFRQKKFAAYKIQRPPTPDGLISQFPLIKEIIAAYHIPIFEKEGYEADDVIATLARKAQTARFSVVIVSSDKDMLQLVDKEITVLSPYKDEGTLYDEEKVVSRFGLAARQIPDVIALMGDTADNIPNVPGIGEGYAVELIKEFGDLDTLLKNTDKIKKEKIRQAIKDHHDLIRLNKELVVLDDRVELEFKPEELALRPPDYNELFRIFKHLEFKKFLKDLPVKEEVPATRKPDVVSDEQIPALVNGAGGLFVGGQKADALYLCVKEKIFHPQGLGRSLKNILEDKTIKKLGHDLKSTKTALLREGVSLEGLYFDTMIAAYLVSPSKPSYALADLAWDYFSQHLTFDTTKEPEKALLMSQRLVPELTEELSSKSLLKLFFELEMPLVEVLADMESCGIRLDLKLLAQLSKDIERKLIILIADIYEASGTQFNINSPKQLAQVLFDKLKLPVIKRTKTGPSTDEEVLRKLASKHKLPELLLEYRQLTKLKNTYIDTLPGLVDKQTGRVHSTFNQSGTETGRLSSTNPNLQNIPVKTEIGRKIRQAVIAFTDDSSLISYDYSQIELRILAHLSGDASLAGAFKEDKDIHKTTAGLIYGIDEKDVDDPMRETAKRVNFGIVYGLTSYGLSRDLGIPPQEAQAFIDAYFLRYPKVKEYITQQIEKARRDGFVTTILGRRRYVPDINNKNQGIRQFAERQAVNTPIQGSASDLIKLAMVDIYRLMKKDKFRSQMILQIHDELLFNVFDSELNTFSALVKDRMENVLVLDVPVRVSIKKGRDWLNMEEIR